MSKAKKKAAAVVAPTAKPAPAGQHAAKVTPPAHHHRQPHAPAHEVYFVFGRSNYIIVLVGVAMLALGYALMTGGATDPNHPEIFDAAAKYSFRQITLAPIIVILGLCVLAFAIMYKGKNVEAKQE